MSAQGLAIIFAPSILRTAQKLSPMDSLRDVNKQAVLVFTFFVEVVSCSSECVSSIRYVVVRQKSFLHGCQIAYQLSCFTAVVQ